MVKRWSKYGELCSYGQTLIKADESTQPSANAGQNLIKPWINTWSNPGQTPGQNLDKHLAKTWSNPG
jgi:hypothetical protein